MEEEKEIIIYTLVYHQTRLKLGLSVNEYCVADIIYHLSNNPQNEIKGWCYVGKKQLGGYIGLTEQSIHTILKKLIHLNLIEKNEETRYLRTTEKWYNSVVMVKIRHSRNFSPTKETEEIRLKKLDLNTKETLDNNNINNNINKNNNGSSDDKPLKRKEFSVSKEIYKELTDAYQKYKGIELVGAEFGDVNRALKTMLYSGRTKEQIVSFMKFCSEVCEQITDGDDKLEKKLGWIQNWTILTIKRKMPEFMGGKLQMEVEDVIVPSYAK